MARIWSAEARPRRRFGAEPICSSLTFRPTGAGGAPSAVRRAFDGAELCGSIPTGRTPCWRRSESEHSILETVAYGDPPAVRRHRFLRRALRNLDQRNGTPQGTGKALDLPPPCADRRSLLRSVLKSVLSYDADEEGGTGLEGTAPRPGPARRRTPARPVVQDPELHPGRLGAPSSSSARTRTDNKPLEDRRTPESADRCATFIGAGETAGRPRRPT